MACSLTVRLGRITRQVVMIGALILTLGGSMASPAAANQRGDAVTAANDFINGCVANGGDIGGIGSKDEFVVVVCAHENGSSQQCQWEASNDWERTCWWDYPEVRPNGDDLGVEIGDTTYQTIAASRQGATVQAAGQADSGKHRQHKAKDHVRKHGKSKGHGKGGRHK